MLFSSASRRRSTAHAASRAVFCATTIVHNNLHVIRSQFAPPEKLSAAAALGTLYYFVLAHQASFDVRWCRGAIGELIFKPFVQKLESMGVTLLGGRRVTEIKPASGSSGSSSSDFPRSYGNDHGNGNGAVGSTGMPDSSNMNRAFDFVKPCRSERTGQILWAQRLPLVIVRPGCPRLQLP